jgi:glycerophosphoryl diester phosphodiesterase
MRFLNCIFPPAVLALYCSYSATALGDNRENDKEHYRPVTNAHSVQLGPRPFFLVEDMTDSDLKKDFKAAQSIRSK